MLPVRGAVRSSASERCATGQRFSPGWLCPAAAVDMALLAVVQNSRRNRYLNGGPAVVQPGELEFTQRVLRVFSSRPFRAKMIVAVVFPAVVSMALFKHDQRLIVDQTS